ncbi:ATP-binding cassette domain-containing protein [Motilibacter deserti]|uniref:ABC transporter ATP-binding protein n=1 Tax=Motilibacter deserti TaxID=2714956 RepID=A0ABX0GZF3_9ACTN|nr:ABC transporter ATP-binding protein [Motilibacter deserti]NHC15046.1 ABC transporter ATP-binding protein [Motilibacter deserti]
MSDPLVQLKGVSRRFEERLALRPVDLALKAGGCVALVGENGSGKSTLLRIACGRDAPTTGTALFDGAPVREDDPAVRARVAVVADAPAFYPDLTVREHLLLVAVSHGVGDDAEAWVDWALEDRRLTDHRDARPSTLSSGQVQAMLLASALVRPRDLLVLDEPEQRLDPGARERLAERLLAERADGVAVLLATHSADLASAVADSVIVLDEGRVVSRGKPA